MAREIFWLREPDGLQCGQAVLAMLTGVPVEAIVRQLGNDRETTLKEMRQILSCYGIGYDLQRREAQQKSDLPQYALLSLETPRCWHWSLYACGTFYDPEHGILEDFPAAKRKFYWELKLPPEGAAPD